VIANTEALSKVSSSRRVRLCLASPLFFPTYGGSQLRFMGYFPGLRERALDITVFTGTPLDEDVSPDSAVDWSGMPVGGMLPEEKIAGVPVRRVTLPHKRGWRRTSVYNRALMQYCLDPEHRPDVLQLVGTLRPQSIPMLRKLRSLGIKVLYAVTVAPKKRTTRQWWSFRQYRELKLLSSVDCIVANNEPLREFVRSRGIRTSVEVIPNGVDLQRFHPAEKTDEVELLRTSLGICKDDMMLLAVGAVMPRKGTDILIEAWAKLASRYPRVHLVLVGPRKDLEHPRLSKFRQRLEKLLVASGAADRVHFTGLRDDVAAWYRAADIFVLPSEREGMPNSVLEAMASGVPVVVTPYIGLSTDIGSSQSQYLLAERDADSLAETLERLVVDEALRVKLGHSGREWVEQTMSLESSLDRYAALYHELSEPMP